MPDASVPHRLDLLRAVPVEILYEVRPHSTEAQTRTNADADLTRTDLHARLAAGPAQPRTHGARPARAAAHAARGGSLAHGAARGPRRADVPARAGGAALGGPAVGREDVSGACGHAAGRAALTGGGL